MDYLVKVVALNVKVDGPRIQLGLRKCRWLID